MDQTVEVRLEAINGFCNGWTSLAAASISERTIFALGNNRRLVGVLALFGGVLCWGITPVMLRRLTPYLDGWTANGIRYPLSAVLYWPLLVVWVRTGRLDQEVLRRCLVPALLAMGGQVFWSLSHYHLQASEIGFLVRLSMVWSIVGAMFLFQDERRLLRSAGFYVGLGLIVGGFLVMTAQQDHPTTRQPDWDLATGSQAVGILYILLCGLCFGLYMVSVRLYLANVGPVMAFGVVCQIVSVGLLIGMFVMGDVRLITTLDGLGWGLTVSSSLLGIAIGHILLYTAVQRLGPAISSCCQTLMPFITATTAGLVLREQLHRQQWMGGFVIIAGAIVLLSIRHSLDPVRKVASTTAKE